MARDHIGLLRLPTVLRICGISRSQLYPMVGKAEFPRPVHIGRRAVAWRERDVVEWLEARPVVSR